MEISYLSSCDHTLLFAGWGCKKQPVLHLFKAACFFVRTVQKCLYLIAGNDALSLNFSADFAEQLRMSRFSAGRRWKNAKKGSHTELHQPGTCPIIFILGIKGSINISMGLERTPFCVLITCFKWTFLEISGCSKMKNWLDESLPAYSPTCWSS